MNRSFATQLKGIALTALIVVVTTPVQANNDSKPQARIVGGREVSIDVAPATAALLNNSRLASSGSYYQSQFCGGTVVATRWVLTAAHCIVNNGAITAAETISVLMGTTDLENPVNQPVNVIQVIPHAAYDAASHANDIALLQLEYDALVTPVALETQATVFDDNGLIVGWGATNESNDTQPQYFPTTLNGALVRLIPGTDCEQNFAQLNGRVFNSNVCAGLPTGGKDTCQGDSGGPLYFYDESDVNAQRLVGVTSWGIGCGSASSPGVYARVAAYTNWIENITTKQEIPANDGGSQNTPQSAQGNSSRSSGGGAPAGILLLMLCTTLWLRRRR